MSAGRALVALAATLALACGSTPTQPQAPASGALQHATAHFIFHYTAADADSIPETAVSVEARSRAIVADLRAGEMAPVHVWLYSSHDAMADAVRPFVGTIPSWAGGLVTGADRIHVIAPSRSGQTPDRFAVTVLHEFGHCVTLHIDAAAGNNPRWLWESIALYEAGQFVDPRTLPYMTGGQVPTLAALNDVSNRQIYDVGYLLGEFIVETGGRDALRSLIVRRGDTAAVLDLDIPAFEARWREFLQRRYGVP